MRRRNLVLIVIVIAVLLLLAIQIIPIGSIVPALAQTNPPVQSQIVWDSPQTEQLVRGACYDCHSNETVWPAYASVAPVSWLLAHDVNDGREQLNFSVQSADQIDPEELVQQIERGEMPKPIYLPLHPEARLTDAQKQALIDGLRASLHGTRRGRGRNGG